MMNQQETFAKEGLSYTMEGKTGNTLNSHRLIALAGGQGPDKQDKLVEALFRAYFTQVRHFYSLTCDVCEFVVTVVSALCRTHFVLICGRVVAKPNGSQLLLA